MERKNWLLQLLRATSMYTLIGNHFITIKITPSRPIIGYININASYFQSERNDTADQIRTVLHELTHVLGFSPTFFSKFIDPATRKTLPESQVVQ